MNIAFRVDASRRIGSGHLARCINLARELERRYASCLFVCRDHPDQFSDRVEEAGFELRLLPKVSGKATRDRTGYGFWLGMSEERDAADFCQAIDGTRFDWAVVDHYGIGAAWERKVGTMVGRVMAIDDLHNRPHDCAVLLNQNLADDDEYSELVPANCQQLLGPEFALLNSDFRAARPHWIEKDRSGGSVFVFFGSGDEQGLTERALQSLCEQALKDLPVDVLVSPTFNESEHLIDLAKRRGKVTLHDAQPSLASLLSQARFGIGAGGVTNLERLCLGVPSLVVCIADNQREVCERLHEHGIICYLGLAEQVDSKNIRDALKTLIADPQRSCRMRVDGMLLCDGLGAARAAEMLCPTAREDLVLRKAETRDADLYFRWVNDPAVRRNSLQQDTIEWQAHLDWFRGKVKSNDAMLFVLCASGLEIGQIRFDVEAGKAKIGFSLDPLVRGRRWATTLLGLGLRELEGCGLDVEAIVRRENQASAAAFRRLGFTETGHEQSELLKFVLPAPALRRSE